MPLHIFEERYRLMMRHCLDGDRRFGVVLIKSGSDVGAPAIPEDVGTIARIGEVKTLDDGRMMIGVEGERRFRITDIVEQLPYMKIEAQLLQDDPASNVQQDLMNEVTRALTAYLKLLMGLRGEWVREIKVPIDPMELRYFVGAQLQGDVIGKQGILEATDTSRALELGLRLLEEESAALIERLDEGIGKSLGN